MSVAKEKDIIHRIDFNATTHGQRVTNAQLAEIRTILALVEARK
jgi:hypothetical protein